MAGRFIPTRGMLVFAVAVLGFLMTVPTSSVRTDEQPVQDLANGSRVFTVGEVDYGGGMATLNPFAYTMQEEFETIWPVYSTMVMYDVNNNIIGDLADSWTVSPDGKTWDFKIANNAYFCDPTNPISRDPSRLVTFRDVAWTYYEVSNDTGNHLSSYFNDGYGGVIQSVSRGVNDFEVIITTRTPFAPFLNALTVIPIVPEYIWGHLPSGRTPMNYANIPMVGSGPFYSTMSSVPSVTGILYRNPIWFQESNKGWQIHVDVLQYKTELSAATAWTDLTSSAVDCMIGLTPSQFKDNIINKTTPNVMGFAAETGFVWEYQFNQMSKEDRSKYEKAGIISKGGTNNQLLSNQTVKLALAMCIDRQAFLDQAYMGFGSPADSIIPRTNPWHYTEPTPVEFDPTEARQILVNAGWAWDSLGNPATSSTCPLYQKGETNSTVYWPLSFRLMSLAPETFWDTGSKLIVQWAALAGVQYTRSLVSMGMANTLWYRGDYDAWLWDWWFSPNSDPSTDILQIHTTMAIGSWSGSYWSNRTYDTLYNQSLSAVDEGLRHQIVNQMQAMLYDDHSAIYPAYRAELYACNYATWDRQSFGNWSSNSNLIPDTGLPWLYMQLSPNSNLAPTVECSPSMTAVAGVSQTFIGSATDSSSLEYQWHWGDGTSTGWQTIPEANHAYTSSTIYTAYFVAREIGTGDAFSSYAVVKVTVAAAPQLFQLNLISGWNFVSIPFIDGGGYTSATLGLAYGEVIAEWNESKWGHLFIVGISPPSLGFTIKQSTCYAIWVAASRTLSLYGTFPTTVQTIQIVAGWNAICLITQKTWHASDIPKMCTAPIVSEAIFDPVSKIYKTWLPAVPLMNDFLILPGAAFFIYASGPGTLSCPL